MEKLNDIAEVALFGMRKLLSAQEMVEELRENKEVEVLLEAPTPLLS